MIWGQLLGLDFTRIFGNINIGTFKNISGYIILSIQMLLSICEQYFQVFSGTHLADL